MGMYVFLLILSLCGVHIHSCRIVKLTFQAKRMKWAKDPLKETGQNKDASSTHRNVLSREIYYTKIKGANLKKHENKKKTEDLTYLTKQRHPIWETLNRSLRVVTTITFSICICHSGEQSKSSSHHAAGPCA